VILWGIGSAALLLLYLLPFAGVAYAASARLYPEGRASVRLLASLVLVTGFLLAAVKGLLLFHAFTLVGFGVLSGMVLTGLIAYTKRHPFWSFLREDAAGAASSLRQFLSPPAGLLLWPGALLICFTAVRALFTPPLSWDSLFYHMTLSGMFVQEGGNIEFDMPQSYGNFTSYPHDLEQLTALGMLPFHSDTAANLVLFPFWVLGALSLYALSDSLGIDRRRWRAGLALWTFTPALFAYLPTQYVEPAVLALAMAGMAFTCRFFEGKDLPTAALAVLSFSLAFGMKSHALAPYVLGVGGILLFALRKCRWSWRAWVLLFCLAAIGLSHTFENTIRHGNPFYPFPTRILGHRLGEVHPSMAEYEEEADRHERKWAAERGAERSIPKLAPYLYSLAQVYSNSHITLGTASLVVTLLGLLGLGRVRNRWTLALILLNLLGAWALFFAPSMEGLRLLFSLSYARLLTWPHTLGLLLGLLALPRFKVVDVLLWILAFAQMGFSVHEVWIVQDVYWMALAAGVFGLLAFSLWRRSGAGPIALAVLAVAGMPWIQHTRDMWRFSYLGNSYDVSPISTRAVSLYPPLDDPAVRRIIAVAFGEPRIPGISCYPYPLLGRRLQNRIVYVPPTRSGRIADYELLAGSGEELDERAWLERLDASGADHLVISVPWTPEMAWVMAHPERFQSAGEAEGLRVFRLRPPVPALPPG
jgi:hypothetical protein